MELPSYPPALLSARGCFYTKICYPNYFWVQDVARVPIPRVLLTVWVPSFMRNCFSRYVRASNVGKARISAVIAYERGLCFVGKLLSMIHGICGLR